MKLSFLVPEFMWYRMLLKVHYCGSIEKEKHKMFLQYMAEAA